MGGDRQKGRLCPDNIVNCKALKADIVDAIKKTQTSDFQNTLCHVNNPYDNGSASETIVSYLKNFPLKGLLKKQFYESW